MSDIDSFVKSSFGWLEMRNYSSSPGDAGDRYGIAFVSGTLQYYNGSSWSSISGSSDDLDTVLTLS